MTGPALGVRVLPDLPNTPGPAAPGGRRRPEAPPVDGATALDPASDPTRTPLSPPSSLRLLPGRGTPEPTGEADQRRLLVRAHRFVQAVVEIVSGDRPCTQLVRWTDREVYDDLATRVAALSDTTGSAPAPGRPGAKVVSIKVCRPCDGVAEIAAHVRQGHRSHALAARLERAERRWICTALELG